MGRMRSALRSYALESDDPAVVLDKLDRKMQHFEPNVMATVLYAVCPPELRSAKIASAGHWPPVLAAPGRRAELLDLPPDILIGLDPAPRRRATTIDIPPDAVLCLYTDGLIDRPDRPLEENLDRLCETVLPGPPDAVCAAVMAALIGRDPVRDDTALLTLRRGTEARTPG
jgi:sigma-B regulation protein RsbU (phosphoserine phosphatase)